MKLEILKYPDARLRTICKEIEDITPEISTLAHDMLETMYASKGVGLAAPQIGKSIRMIVMDHAQNEDEPQPQIFINPKIKLLGEQIISENEGCLSVPLNYRADIIRSNKVELYAKSINGENIHRIIEGFPAIIIQHEVDHLDGNLFIDKISHLRRSIYDKKVKKWLRNKTSE